MSPEEDLILCLCRVDGVAQPPAGEMRWELVVETALEQRVAAQVFAGLDRLELPPADAEYLRSEAKAEFVGTALRKQAIRAALGELEECLGRAQIELVLMKGLSLDFDGLRPARDLDVLIHEHDLEKALTTLAEAGYRYVGDDINHHVRKGERGDFRRQLEWNNQFQLRDPHHSVLIELHTNLFERRRTHVLDLDALLDRIDVFWESRAWDEHLGCHVFSNDMQLITMALYAGIRHSPAKNNFRLQTLVDVDRIVRRGVDWAGVVGHSRQFRVLPYMVYALTMATRLLGTPIPEDVMGELEAAQSQRERIASRWHLRSFRSLNDSSLLWSKLYFMAQPFLLGSRWSDRVRHFFLMPVLFPPRWRMALFFDVDEDSPLIYLTYLANPFRWLLIVARRGLR